MPRQLAIFLVIIAVSITALFLIKKSDVVQVDEVLPAVVVDPMAEFLKPLANPPKEIKAVYATGWSGGSTKKMDYFIDLIKTTELNALVVDIKDYSGYIAYDIQVPDVIKYKAVEIKIPDLDELIYKLHKNNIYVIARLTVFQDPRFALARPDLAVKSKKTGLTWKDNKGLSWMDPMSREVWDYNIAIAKDAALRGFDEINFDYIRFPSDGAVDDLDYTFWDGQTSKSYSILSFFSYLRNALLGTKISADLFGYTTVLYNDLGIGQIIEHAYKNFDYVSPMVYPSHYTRGYLNFSNPGAHPYEVVYDSISTAVRRLNDLRITLLAKSSSTPSLAKLRPWLQDFDLGADYTPEMVRAQIKATYDSASTTPEAINGFMIWNASNIYQKGAFLPE
ncbi:MAG: putative glycoside hydrolase [Patescibacteria group bacterium]